MTNKEINLVKTTKIEWVEPSKMKNKRIQTKNKRKLKEMIASHPAQVDMIMIEKPKRSKIKTKRKSQLLNNPR